MSNTPATLSTPESDRIELQIIEILAEQVGVPALEITREHRLMELGDSLDRTEAVMKMEEQFEISLPDEVQEARTVGDLVEFVRGVVGKRP